jgi:hypothetical protein
MARYKPNPSIAERGGLEVYLTGLGIDYELFKTLRNTIGDKYTSIAVALSKKAKLTEPLRPGRVKEWCRVDDQEDAPDAESTTD